MQISSLFLALFSVSSVHGVTCGWDGNMQRLDCVDLLSSLAEGSDSDYGSYDYKKCHIRLSKVGARVNRMEYIEALRDCVLTCNKFTHIYCRYPNLSSVKGGQVDMIVGTHV